MTDSIEIRSSTGLGSLKLSQPRPEDRTRRLETFLAELTHLGLTASTTVYEHDFAGLTALFLEMGRDWKGWKGSKDWRSLEGEMELKASADGLGHVRLEVSLGPNADPDDWRARAVIQLDAGSLAAKAAAIEQFVLGR